MPIFIDDEQIDLAAEDLAAVLAGANEQLGSRQRVIVEVLIDGESVSGQMLDQAQTVSVTEREVRLYSAEPRQLAGDVLEQVKEQLSLVRSVHEEAAELLQQDNAQAALAKIAEAIDAWLQTMQAVSHSAVLLGVDLSSLDVDGGSVQVVTDDLADKLTTLKELIEARDTVGLADTLSYEWPEVIDRWENLVGQLLEAIR